MNNFTNSSLPLKLCVIWDLYNHRVGRVKLALFSATLWGAILTTIVGINFFVNFVTYRIRSLRNSPFYGIIFSNFLNQLIFGVSICAGEITSSVITDINCTQLKVIYFFQVMGELSIILGIIALAILQYLHLKSREINNQMSTIGRFGGQINIIFHLGYIWGVSIVLSIIPILIDHKSVITMPSLAAGIGLILYIIGMVKLYQLINARHLQSANDKLRHSLIFIKGSGLLILVTWVPDCTARMFWFLRKTNIVGDISLYFLSHCSVMYPVLQPLLYIFITKEVRDYLHKWFSNAVVAISPSGEIDDNHLPRATNNHSKIFTMEATHTTLQ